VESVLGTPNIYTTTGLGPRKNGEMAGVDDLVVYMQTAVKYSSLYTHHPGGGGISPRPWRGCWGWPAPPEARRAGRGGSQEPETPARKREGGDPGRGGRARAPEHIWTSWNNPDWSVLNPSRNTEPTPKNHKMQQDTNNTQQITGQLLHRKTKKMKKPCKTSC